MATENTTLLRRISRFWSGSIRRQLILGVVLVHAAMMSVFVFDLVHRQQSFLHGEALKQSVALSETLAVNASSWLLASDVVGLEEVVFSQAGYPGLTYAMITDDEGRVVAHTDPEYVGQYTVDARSRSVFNAKEESFVLFENARQIDAAAAILANGERIGWARVGIDQSAVEGGLKAVGRDGLIYTFAAIALGALFAWIMARGLTGSLHQLVSVADGIRSGRRKTRAHLDRNDELGRLADDFNLMLDHLEEAEGKLAASEQRFRDIAESASDWFWEMDADLRFSFVSDRNEKIGLQGHKALGRTRLELLPPDLAANPSPELLAHLDDLENHRPFRNFEYVSQILDGRNRTVRISGRPIFDRNGRFQGYRGTGTDITREKNVENALRDAHAELEVRVESRTRELTKEIAERKKVEEELLAAKENADAANRAKSDFLSNMSHELRTPLNAIIGFTSVMKQKVFGSVGHEKYREYVDDILQSGEHLLALINDVLDVSSIEAGKLELHDSVVDPVDSVNSVLRMLEQKAAVEGLTLESDLPNDLPNLVADARRTRQIFLNLLSNAVKFTPPGGHIVVSGACGSDGGLTFRVTDTGVGMAPEDIDIALSRYGRVETQHVLAKEGTGLGLPLTKALIEAHGGTFGIESVVGEGTTVVIAFPPERVKKV